MSKDIAITLLIMVGFYFVVPVLGLFLFAPLFVGIVLLIGLLISNWVLGSAYTSDRDE